MAEEACCSVLVCDGDRLCGLFTERDLVTRVVGRGLDPKETRLAEVMTRDPDRVWLRDLLGTLDHQHGPGQDARIGRRAAAGIGEAPVLRRAPPDDLLRRAPAQHALAAGVAGLVEAGQQPLEVAAAGDGDAEHLPLHAAVEALGRAVGARRAGPGLAVLDAGLAAALPEALGRGAGAAVGREVRDPEREGRDRLLQEGLRAGLGLAVLDREVDPPGAPVGQGSRMRSLR